MGQDNFLKVPTSIVVNSRDSGSTDILHPSDLLKWEKNIVHSYIFSYYTG